MEQKMTSKEKSGFLLMIAGIFLLGVFLLLTGQLGSSQERAPDKIIKVTAHKILAIDCEKDRVLDDEYVAHIRFVRQYCDKLTVVNDKWNCGGYFTDTEAANMKPLLDGLCATSRAFIRYHEGKGTRDQVVQWLSILRDREEKFSHI